MNNLKNKYYEGTIMQIIHMLTIYILIGKIIFLNIELPTDKFGTHLVVSFDRHLTFYAVAFVLSFNNGF